MAPAPYRAPPARRAPRVIETSVWRARTLAAVWVAGTVFLVAISQRVVLQCERGREPTAGVCVAKVERLVWTSDPVRIPIAEMVGAKVQEEDDGASRVAVMTKDGDVPLTSSLESGLRGEKRAMAEAVQRFIRDPTARKLSASYGARWTGNIEIWGVFTFAVALLSIFVRKVRVVVDRDAGAVHLVRPRFPFGKKEESFELAEVVRADVEELSGSDETTSRVVLLLADGRNMPLTRTHSSGRRSKDEVADKISAALAERD